MTDNIFGELRAFDQGIELDAGLDAELVAHKDEILGADVAGGALMSAANGQPPRPATDESNRRTPISSPA